MLVRAQFMGDGMLEQKQPHTHPSAKFRFRRLGKYFYGAKCQ
jgi:hypothetical protein